MARAPTLAAALTLAMVALRMAIRVLPIDDEVPATPQRAPWPVAVLSFALAIFAINDICMKREEDW